MYFVLKYFEHNCKANVSELKHFSNVYIDVQFYAQVFNIDVTSVFIKVYIIFTRLAFSLKRAWS